MEPQASAWRLIGRSHDRFVASELEQQAWRDDLSQQAALQLELNDPNLALYPNSYRGTDLRLGMITLASIFTVPSLIFARLVIDSYRDECRSRAERKGRQNALDIQVALSPRPEPQKPQWID